MKRLTFAYLFTWFCFSVNAQNAILKSADAKSFSSKKFFNSLFVDKQQFKNLRLVHDSLSNDDFWMDAQEVTNGEYKAFTNYCRDSIVLKLLGYVKSGERGWEILDWKKKLSWNKAFGYSIDAFLTIKGDDFRRHDDARLDIDASKIEYGKWLDTSNIVAVYPDTLCWLKENVEDTGTSKIYFSAPYLKNHPVVGISYWQATAYCKWLEEIWNSALQKAGDVFDYFEVRLPNKKEWNAALKIESPQYIDLAFPFYAKIKSNKLIYNLSGNVAEWLYDSSDMQTNTANLKEVTDVSWVIGNFEKHQPAITQHSYIGFRYVVRLKKSVFVKNER